MTTDELAGDTTVSSESLARRLSGGGLYVRTGLLLLPQLWLGREAEIAARLNLGFIDYPAWRAARLRDGEKLLRYSAERLVSELDAICAESQDSNHLLVANLDLPVSALNGEDGRRFVTFLRENFSKRPRSLLVCLPQSAGAALPWDADLDVWTREGRLARWNP